MLPWILRTACLFGLLTTFWIATPSRAIARPYDIDPGPGVTGDPTADDQPSPAPKPKHAAAVNVSRESSHNATLGRGHIVTIRVPWDVYLRLLARTWVR
jgi:hypothetical protein